MSFENFKQEDGRVVASMDARNEKRNAIVKKYMRYHFENDADAYLKIYNNLPQERFRDEWGCDISDSELKLCQADFKSLHHIGLLEEIKVPVWKDDKFCGFEIWYKKIIPVSEKSHKPKYL